MTTEVEAQPQPALATGPYQIMPLYTEEQFQELKEDIRRHGVLQPIVKDQTGQIIDGYHRFRAFEELISEGVDLPMFETITMKFSSEEEKVEYLVALNVKRRHLTIDQKSELCGRLRSLGYTWSKIGEMVGMTSMGALRAYERLDEETRAQINQTIITGKDGRQLVGFQVPSRLFQTGQAQLREMQQAVVKAYGEQLRANGNGEVAYTPPANELTVLVPRPAPSESIPNNEAQ